MTPTNRTSGTPESGQGSAAHDSLVNRHVGNFRIEQFLAEGAMGRVYLGVHDTLARKVAIKVLRPELSQEQRLVDRFIDEAQIVSGLGHPGIAQITDFGRLDDGTFYAVMEYLDGVDALEALEHEGPMRPERVASIGVQVAAALAVVHERGIVHRDLKPANIFLIRDDAGIERVKILDFGIAKLHDPAKERSRTQEGFVVGTPDYMAPEQALLHVVVTNQTDIYGLGCVLYELLCGHAPFDADSILALLLAHRKEQPKDLDALVQSLPDGFSAVIMRCLAKKPADRWPDAQALASALAPFAAAAPGDVEQRTQTLDVPTRAPRRTRLLVTMLVASAALAIAFFQLRMPDATHTVRSATDAGAVAEHASRLATLPADVTPADAAPADAAPTDAAAPAGNPFSPGDDLVVAEGAAIFASACSECHGVSGEGDGQNARVDTTPRAFSHLNIALGMLDNYRFGVVQRGIGNKMPSFGETLSNGDIWKVVTFISTLSTHEPPSRSDEIWQLEAPAMTARMVKQGRRLFARECRGCHGPTGRGDGPASTYLGRRPSDLSKGVYKIRTTSRDSVPTSADIYRTLTKGMGVTGMPGFSTLSPRARWQLVAFLQSLSPRFRKHKRPRAITIPMAPALTDAAVHRGRANYLAAGCAKCHGDTGLGDGELAADLKSLRGDVVRPANFSVPSTFIGGSTPRELYRTMMTGIAGTPMPAGDDFFDEDEAWDVIAYILSLGEKHADR